MKFNGKLLFKFLLKLRIRKIIEKKYVTVIAIENNYFLFSIISHGVFSHIFHSFKESFLTSE